MKKIFSFLILAIAIISCNNKSQSVEANKDLATLLDQYYEERLQLFPLEATSNGDNRFNDRLYIDFTNSYREKLKTFYSNYENQISKFERAALNENDQISYDVFKREMQMSIKGLSFKDNLAPLNQFWGLHLTLGQLGSGEGNQPFKTVEDYDNWVRRATVFSEWTDSAIAYFKKGINENYVLPKSLVVKIIPQCKSLVVDDITTSLFWGPIKKLPATFNDADKKRITEEYTNLLKEQIIPSYKKLGDFFEKEYLVNARTTSGINGNPTGDEYYKYLIQYWTTTNKTPEEIYTTGLAEVKRIREEMVRVMNETGFYGNESSLKAFFEFMKTDKQFMPFKTAEDVLNAYRSVQKNIDPNLKKMFGMVPKTPFEIRQTEAFRAASASAEYNQGSADGSRPGIFYVPIIDATKYNTTSGLESLFLHEAIPGHHYQISLQQENESLPKFRRFSWYGAYGEGWALYCESLGKELGLYTDPYQYMGALGDEIHRAIRLVVDVAIHTKNMSREEAIKYMMDNEAISEEGATAEIERYMAIPAQALSYKTGALKIQELRDKYKKQHGEKFSLKNFHDVILKDGCLPLDVLEKKMDTWAKP
ncbi:MAG: DUF885 domain-containing protein [Chitinophagaceae bacterium]|nr:DUF885 domain-containing protein [Chitinophagaceae bacterium]